MKSLPAAESYAIKDAAEKLGILFGKNLNRKDTIAFSGAYSETRWSNPKEKINGAATKNGSVAQGA
jgi:hypothetical protein